MLSAMGGSNLDPEPLCRAIRGPAFLNKVLIAICKAESLPHTGVKADMQTRISESIRRYANANNVAGFNRLKGMIDHPHQSQNFSHSGYSPSPAAASPYAAPNNYNQYQFNMAPVSGAPFRAGLPVIDYKESPFYTPRAQLGPTKPCDSENDCAHFPKAKKTDKKKAMTHHRHTVEISLRTCDHSLLDEAFRDKSLRVMIFCSGETGPRQDVAFPHQSEIKINGGEIKANLRGLKNKPGSTRPVDITDLLRLRPVHYANTIQMTYALTTKKFYLSLWIVKSTPVEDLVRNLEAGRKMSKESVLREMVVKASDPDIETTSTVLSLKCPLSTLRISLPCRSTRCKHNQCFDATSYLQLQEQGPTWLCPICNNPAPFKDLAVDEYLKDILKSTNSSLEQVTVEPDGKWSMAAKIETPKHNRSSMMFGSDDDDDLIEIRDDNIPKPSSSNGRLSHPSISRMKTPDSTSFDGDKASASQKQNAKRQVSEVVDLTLSDDDDDPPRPMKKPITHSNDSFDPNADWVNKLLNSGMPS